MIRSLYPGRLLFGTNIIIYHYYHMQDLWISHVGQIVQPNVTRQKSYPKFMGIVTVKLMFIRRQTFIKKISGQHVLKLLSDFFIGVINVFVQFLNIVLPNSDVSIFLKNHFSVFFNKRKEAIKKQNALFLESSKLSNSSKNKVNQMALFSIKSPRKILLLMNSVGQMMFLCDSGLIVNVFN